MAVFILVLLLIAAIFGVLGAVLKVALVLALSFTLAFAIIAVGGYWYLRHRMRKFVRGFDVQQRGYPTTGTKRPGPSLPPE
jgi:membrane protein implicated in regulation of membrane protease activity